MDKKLLFAVLPASFVAPLVLAATGSADGDSRPNILFIIADDMGKGDLSCYGNTWLDTPNIDGIGEAGLQLQKYRCAAPISGPSRVSVLTGRYHERSGYRMTHYEKPSSVEEPWIARTLLENGYSTIALGKWHLGDADYRGRGFEDWVITAQGGWSDYYSYKVRKPGRDVMPSDSVYATDFLTDEAIDFLHRRDESKPFFMYLAYTAPHWPLHALPEDIAKYEDTYKVGWEAIRNARYERQQEMGLFGDQKDFLSARQFNDRWEDNPDAEWDARAMAVHAAMVDRMDQGIGSLIDALEETGQLDNTLILFLSDNGCSSEICQNFIPGANDRPDMTRDGRPVVYPKDKEVLPGPETTYASLGPKWANVANTPFRFWKAKAYEGGICTPMIAHWPDGIRRNIGGVTEEYGHVMDIMATCMELAGAEYPETYNGNEIIPMEGISLVPIFTRGHREGHEYLGFEHFHERAFISADGWKIVRPGHRMKWELYNLNEDRSEQHNMAAEYPEKVAEMAAAYDEWAKRCMVEPSPGQKKKNR